MEERILMELLCCVQISILWQDITMASNNVTETLGQVDERLAVYSQIQRRKVSQTRFVKILPSWYGSMCPVAGGGWRRAVTQLPACPRRSGRLGRCGGRVSR